MVIYKYELSKPVNEFEFEKDARIISVTEQNKKIVMYVLHIEPKDKRKEKKKIAVIQTGHDFDFAVTRFLGTVGLRDGEFVVHIFEAL